MVPTDFYDDENHQQLYALDKLYGLPAFVKTSAMEPRAGLTELPTHAFADPVRRKFPCHSKEATWLAQAYFSLNKSSYTTKEANFVQDRIDRHAAYWGIKGLCEGFKKSWSKMAGESVVLSDGDYALAVTHEGQPVRRMPIHTAVAVKHAGEFLAANRYNYPYAWRKAAARRILARAMEFDKQAAAGKAVPGAGPGTHFDPATLEYLERAAGFGACHPLFAAEKIAQRAYMLSERHVAYQEKLAELALAVKELPDLDLEKAAQLADLIDGVDRATGLYHRYADGVDMPEEIFFQILEKEAAAVLDEHVQLTSGTTYPLEAFAAIPLDKVAAILGDDFAKEVTVNGQVDPQKFAELARTLPRPDALMLDKVIHEAAKTMAKEARARVFDNAGAWDVDEMNAYAASRGTKIERQVQGTVKLPHPQSVAIR